VAIQQLHRCAHIAHPLAELLRRHRLAGGLTREEADAP
jgi:hypothetical protein